MLHSMSLWKFGVYASSRLCSQYRPSVTQLYSAVRLYCATFSTYYQLIKRQTFCTVCPGVSSGSKEVHYYTKELTRKNNLAAGSRSGSLRPLSTSPCTLLPLLFHSLVVITWISYTFFSFAAGFPVRACVCNYFFPILFQ